MCKLFVLMHSDPFQKTHVTGSPCSGEETADDLPQDTKHLSVRTRISHNPFNQYLILPIILTMQRTGKGF